MRLSFRTRARRVRSSDAMKRPGSLVLAAVAAASLVMGALPSAAAPASPAPTPSPTVSATPEPTPTPETSEAPAIPNPETSYAPPPVAKVPMQRDEAPAGAPKPAEKDRAGDETLDVADPGNTPFPAGGSSGSVDGASGARLLLQRPAQSIVKAAAVVGFAAGDIISDAVFGNRASMTEDAIRSFIDGKVATCQSGYTCLELYRETTPTRAADAYCGQYTGGTTQDAARIIYRVAQACGVNPQVLLVMLQKEQGLVTHTWPSDFRYTIAMGMGCPDTAACDTLYYGFFNQVYGAARQMKIYAQSSYFTWYAPGGTRSIGYHPNASCGASGVYVKNDATAGLYYYTPYQPNAAALAAGFGTGDSCSSYGNRNFYNYFTAWFGPTGGGSIVAPTKGLISYGTRTALVSNGTEYPIPGELVSLYRGVFGTVQAVTQAQADLVPDGPVATAFVRDASSGIVAMLDAGQRHAFSTCTQVALWGGQCGTETVLSTTDFGTIGAGTPMGPWARKMSAGQIFWIGSVLAPIYNEAHATRLNGGTVPYAPVMSPAAASKLATGVTRFGPGLFIRTSTSTATFLPTWDLRLLQLPTWEFAAELGLPYRTATTGVAGPIVQKYTKVRFTQLVRCGGKTWFPAQKTLYQVTSAAAAGFPTTTLDARTCGLLKRSTVAAVPQLFVKSTTSDEVYVGRSGDWTHVPSWADLLELTGGKTPRILPVGAATLSWMLAH